MRVGPPRRITRDGAQVLEAEVSWGDRREVLWFSWEGLPPGAVDDTSDPFVPATLVPAMAAGESVLEFEGPVSPRLLGALPRLIDIYLRWHPGFRPLEVRAQARTASPAPPAPGCASFFSLGVDSFYTVLQHGPEGERTPRVDTLLFTRGLERPLESSEQWPEVSAVARQVARERGLGIGLGATNLRTLFPLDWFTVLHGPGLAATGLSVGPGFGTVIISGGHGYEEIKPEGSSWLTEERYSTEGTALCLDGGEASRIEKVAWLADHPGATRNLRVCTANRAGVGNCGRCRKCVRTMLALALAGRLEGSPAFPMALPANLESYLHGESALYAREFRWYASTIGGEPAIADRILRALDERDRRHHLREWLERSMWAPLLPAIRGVRRFLRPS